MRLSHGGHGRSQPMAHTSPIRSVLSRFRPHLAQPSHFLVTLQLRSAAHGQHPNAQLRECWHSKVVGRADRRAPGRRDDLRSLAHLHRVRSILGRSAAAPSVPAQVHRGTRVRASPQRWHLNRRDTPAWQGPRLMHVTLDSRGIGAQLYN
jgi:hypothetical protein